MAQDYCSAADLYAHGLPRGAVPNPGRLLAAVDATADTLTLDVHGFAAGDALTFRAEAGGTLPTPLVQGTTYYALPLSDSTFQVAATAGGAAINITASGTPRSVLAIWQLSIPAVISGTSRLIDDMLPAHIVPIEGDVPEIVRITAAELAAAKVQALTGGPVASLMGIFDAAQKRLERWAKGVPIRGEGGQQQAGGATSAALPYDDARGWIRHGGL